MSSEYTKEQEYESKVATENGLLNIGKLMFIEQQKKENIEKIKNELTECIKQKVLKIKTLEQLGAKPLRQANLANLIHCYIQFTEKDINDLTHKLKNLEEDYTILTEESDDLLEQVETLEKREKEYWAPRIHKLREKCIMKNKTLHYTDIVIKVLLVVVFIMYLYIINYDSVNYTMEWVGIIKPRIESNMCKELLTLPGT